MKAVEEGVAAQVLGALARARGEPLSGERLAELSGVTRAAVWKAIETLRRDGLAIEGQPGTGYRLVAEPDRLLPALVWARLGTRWLGRSFVHRSETSSTQTEALAQARDGAPTGTVVVAESQTAGRGRLGRSWHSPPHQNLYLSIVLRPRVAAHLAPPITLVAGAVLARTVARVAGVEAALKWPNDVLVGGRKVAGILTEMAAEVDRVHHLVLGIGVNVNGRAEELPAELADRATTLRASRAGARLSRLDLLAGLLEALEPAFERFEAEGFAPFVPEVNALDALAGSEIVVERGADRLTGRARGVEDDGSLVVERSDGTVERVYSGEVTRARAVG